MDKLQRWLFEVYTYIKYSLSSEKLWASIRSLEKLVHYVLSAVSLKLSTVTAHIFGYLAILYDFSIWLHLGSFKNLVSEFTTMTKKKVFLNLRLTQLQYKVIFPSICDFCTYHSRYKKTISVKLLRGESEALRTNTLSALTTSWDSCTSHVVCVIQWHW